MMIKIKCLMIFVYRCFCLLELVLLYLLLFLISYDGDTILSTGANGALALGTQQRHQVGILRPRLFLRRKIDKFIHSFSPYGSM